MENSLRFHFTNGRLEAVPQHEQENAQTRVQSACSEPTLNLDNEIIYPNGENSGRNKRRKLNSKSSKGRKLTSKVWDDFTKYKDKEGNDRARCKHCEKDFDGSSINGTSRLKNHLESCRSRKINDGEGDKQAAHEKGNKTNPVVQRDKFVINQELSQLDVVRAIIKYGYSNMNVIKPDILRVYNEEKEKLRQYLKNLSCRFSLTTKRVYGDLLMVLHFINDHWELKQKVISFQHQTDDNLVNNLKKSLLDFSVDNNICSVVTDTYQVFSSLTDTYQVFSSLTGTHQVMEEISSWLTKRDSLPFRGHLFSASCIESFLQNYIGNVTYRANAVRIYECFDYVHKTSKEHKFRTAVENAKSKGKKVTSRSIPMSTRGLELLEMVVGFKEAFSELEQIDFDFKPVNLTKEEWDDAEAVYRFLKELNDAAYSLSATKCHTANAFFPKICDIYSKLLLSERSDNHHVREMASSAIARFFDKYWSNYKLVLAIAVFLDPRFKMDIIECWYRKIYGDGADGHLTEIVDGVTNVCREYLNTSSEILDELGRPITFSETPDLVLYLKTPKSPSVQEFDILNWWHSNTSRYPTLARMARDFLAVPIASSAFTNSSWEIEIENMSCNDLEHDIKSAWICTKSWLESSENNQVREK